MRIFIQNNFGGLKKIFGNIIRLDVPFLQTPTGLPARQDKNRFATGFVAGQDVRIRISDEKRLPGVTDGLVQGLESFANGTDLGLSAIASMI